jgi:GWxTD domain-containing protein
MNHGNMPRTFLALGAIFLTVLAAAGCGINTMPTKDVWFTQHYIIMQDFERSAYRSLSNEGKKAFQELFWSARTQDARSTFDARLEYVKENFWKENSQQPWNTDRSRVYLLNGSPASIDVDQNNSWAISGASSVLTQATDRSNEDVAANRAELWIYPYDQYLIKYTFVFVQPYQWKITTTTGSRYLGDFENYNRNVTFGITDLERYQQALAALEKK